MSFNNPNYPLLKLFRERFIPLVANGHKVSWTDGYGSPYVLDGGICSDPQASFRRIAKLMHSANGRGTLYLDGVPWISLAEIDSYYPVLTAEEGVMPRSLSYSKYM
jgi:hypothetical protein